MHKVYCRLKNGKIKHYEVDGVDTAQQAREFVISQVKDASVVLALVNKPLFSLYKIDDLPDDAPPLQRA